MVHGTIDGWAVGRGPHSTVLYGLNRDRQGATPPKAHSRNSIVKLLAAGQRGTGLCILLARLHSSYIGAFVDGGSTTAEVALPGRGCEAVVAAIHVRPPMQAKHQLQG